MTKPMQPRLALVLPKKAAPSRSTSPIKFLSKQEVLALIGVSYATLWTWMRDGNFPLARELVGDAKRNKIVWIESEVHAWMASRPKRRPAGYKGAAR
jgi:predicted DNA-binding transcriptional regulator AlpA